MKLNDFIKFDKYFWIARFFPALIISTPFFVFQYFFLGNLALEKITLLASNPTLFHSIVIILVIYVSSTLVRGFGKDLIEKFYFIRNHKFPTTQILWGKKLVISKQQLMNLKLKIKEDFSIDLIQKTAQKEKLLRIKDSVDLIIVKVGHGNKILNQYSMEYGFFRNLTGGLVIYFLMTFLLLFFSYSRNPLGVIYAICFFFFGIVYLPFSWFVLDNYATKYAKKLFSEYLVKK